MSFDVDAFLSEREGHEAACKIVMKARLVDEISRLHDDLKEAKRRDEWENREPEAPQIQQRIEALREEMEASAREFRFKELPRHVYEALVAEFPPRKEDAEAGAAWNAEKFPPALIAAASAEPGLDRQAATKLWKGLPFGEARRLWITALAPQTKVGAVPLAVSGTGQTPTTETKSGTAPLEGSPDPSSSDVP